MSGVQDVVTPCAGVWIEIKNLLFPLDFYNASLPVRECGLKQIYNHYRKHWVGVTPCAGGWIEIMSEELLYRAERFTPCAGVWIEISLDRTAFSNSLVTPCAGVWIEILYPSCNPRNFLVTPCAGVWIEMDNENGGENKIWRHSLCGSVD